MRRNPEEPHRSAGRREISVPKGRLFAAISNASAARTKEPELAAARRELRLWYDRNKRDLPWRRTSDPYAIWVSEVMLQQTTVKTVAPYFVRFLERFPTVASVARASEEDVLAAWSGLGYYHRARNLHRGAGYLVRHHGSAFPADRVAALGIPGVGLYTASAVLSIAHGLPLAVLDGNVKRVLARFLAVDGPSGGSNAKYHNIAAELLDVTSPGDWNQALMELGATICTPRQPACAACPWRNRCRARAAGLQDVLPRQPRRRAAVDVTVAAALIRRGAKFLFVRRPAGRLMGGMWELPQTSLEAGGRSDLVREARQRYGLRLRLGALQATGRHAITFHRIRLEGHEAVLQGPLPRGEGEDAHRWLAGGEIDGLATSSISRKLIRAVERAQMPPPLGDEREV